MKKYLIKNLEPFSLGFLICLIFIYLLNLIESLIVKIYLIK